MNTWTDPAATPGELDALRQILDGEYRPWNPGRPNDRAEPVATKVKTKATRPTPIFDMEAA